jgi:2-amino-4-hydroxy-6-hydroxymethyldihydropteridine diphosphokinase
VCDELACNNNCRRLGKGICGAADYLTIMENEIYLGLGSNIGDRAENIVSALSLLQSSGYVEIEKISSFYETSPIGPKQRNFYNIAAKAKTALSPKALLALIKRAEAVLGRKPSLRWGKRVIDIDILFYGGKVINIQGLSADSKDAGVCLCALPLTVPHKEIENRLFVLVPLNEIAPDFKHPVLNAEINDILKSKLALWEEAEQRIKIIKI